jgi:hypothetical protein
MSRFFLWFNIVIVVGGMAAVAWVLSLPTKDECLSSGRVVEPTERYCESSAGSELLQEHAWFHSREVILAALFLWIVAYLYHRRMRGKLAPMRK